MQWLGLFLFGVLFGLSGAWISLKRGQNGRNREIKSKLAKAEGIIKSIREGLE